MEALANPAQAQALEREYRRCKQPILKKLRNWFPTLRGYELDLYQSAWESVLRNAHSIDSVEAYLEAAIYTEGLRELRTRRRRQTFHMDAGAVPGDRTTPLPEEEVEAHIDARLLAEVLERLTPLQKKLVALRWGWDIPRKEAAPLLAVSEKTAKRQLERAGAVIAESIELVESGRWCETKRSLVLAYSLELLSSRRAVKAKRHLEVCPGCRQAAWAIRRRLEEVAAVIPPPLLLRVPPAGDLLQTWAQWAGTLRHTLSDVVASAKHHALALFTRTPAAEAATQTATAGGLRGGGGLVAALTTCVLAGGGATYCAIEGVPLPLRDAIRTERPHKPDKKHAAASSEQAPAAVQPSPPPTPGQPTDQSLRTQNSSQPAAPATSAESIPASPAPAGSEEFGPAPDTSYQPKPAPAPAGGGGEFLP
jgi:RNA polymerase sigma factor (sigma-70 family)